jgi:hypothetical protein
MSKLQAIMDSVKTLEKRFDGTRAVAQRIVNAEENFIENVMQIAGLSRGEAEKAMTALKKAKAIKIDPVMGRMVIKHGAFMEPDVLKRAAKS